MTDAYEEGYAVGCEGGSCMRCPYHWPGKLRDDWMKGYQMGYASYRIFGA
ncbi:Rmf/CrpP family protein [Burkholderia vietnamiensis]